MRSVSVDAAHADGASEMTDDWRRTTHAAVVFRGLCISKGAGLSLQLGMLASEGHLY